MGRSHTKTSGRKRRKKKKAGGKLYLIPAILCAAIAAAAIGGIILYERQNQKQQENYEALLQSATGMTVTEAKEPEEKTADKTAPETPGTESEAPVDLSPYNIPEKTLDFAELKKTNKDIYAWITIPDTKVDYPVLQHPTELDYYLEYNLDGSKGYPGCIYSQFLNRKDFSDFNTVLYGHNMKAGTMFANLHYYEDPDFFREHPYLYIYTEEGPLVYRVFAAYTYSNIHLLMGFDLSQEAVREAYLESILSSEGMNDNVDRTVEVTPESRILTLSTCIGSKPDKRYMVSAVLAADGRG